MIFSTSPIFCGRVFEKFHRRLAKLFANEENQSNTRLSGQGQRVERPIIGIRVRELNGRAKGLNALSFEILNLSESYFGYVLNKLYSMVVVLKLI